MAKRDREREVDRKDKSYRPLNNNEHTNAKNKKIGGKREREREERTENKGAPDSKYTQNRYKYKNGLAGVLKPLQFISPFHLIMQNINIINGFVIWTVA